MKQQSDTPNPLDPFGTLRTMRDASLETWSKMMIDVVNSDAYAQATARWLDTYLTASKPLREAVEATATRVLTEFNMPTRDDIISLATRLTNIEMRLDDLDARFDEVQVAPKSRSKAAKGEEVH
jgi:alkyl sulfatase BDS1-like metallo-beta-lactamase superfamily hydrolase